jgi:hypothetical protein
MPQEREIDFELLIERSIRQFQPVRTLWPVGLRLALWIFLESSLLALCASVNGSQGIETLVHNPRALITIGAFTLVSVAAGLLALRSAIPGREPQRAEILIVLVGCCAAFAVMGVRPLAAPSEILGADLHWALQVLGLSMLPWVALFMAVERGVPVQPFDSGGLIGVASFSFGIAADCLISQSNGFTAPFAWRLTFGLLFVTVSALAGGRCLDAIQRWQWRGEPIEIPTKARDTFGRQALVPLLVSASLAGLFLALSSARNTTALIPDFDLAIASYERAVEDFTPNVPSRDVETMLTAYVENGMPSYMWDFTRQGFKFAGGRFEHLPDGAAVTYTWFRGTKGGVMCMFRQTDGFKAPSAAHQEHQRMFFYRYRGFSVCLINVGGYGSFASVIVAPIPMNRFVPLVLAATR